LVSIRKKNPRSAPSNWPRDASYLNEG
jgi:hypothetical protein